MTRGGFDATLQLLNKEINRLGTLVAAMIQQAVEALMNKDTVLGDTVIKNDDLIDNLQKEIEDRSIKLIAMQQPLATDLRSLFTSVKVAADLYDNGRKKHQSGSPNSFRGQAFGKSG